MVFDGFFYQLFISVCIRRKKFIVQIHRNHSSIWKYLTNRDSTRRQIARISALAVIDPGENILNSSIKIDFLAISEFYRNPEVCVDLRSKKYIICTNNDKD